MEHDKLFIVFALIGACFLFQSSHSRESHFSLCDSHFYGNCFNGLASDDGTFRELQPVSWSVKGLWVLFASGMDREEPSGVAEFLFQERVGDYQLLQAEMWREGKLIKATGDYNEYRASAITFVDALSLISNGYRRTFANSGSKDDCIGGDTMTPKSFAVNGVSPWQLFFKNGTSVCVQVEDEFSFVPAIVRDVRTLGFDFDKEDERICYVEKGCYRGDVVFRLPNNETSGLLTR